MNKQLFIHLLPQSFFHFALTWFHVTSLTGTGTDQNASLIQNLTLCFTPALLHHSNVHTGSGTLALTLIVLRRLNFIHIKTISSY